MSEPVPEGVALPDPRLAGVDARLAAKAAWFTDAPDLGPVVGGQPAPLEPEPEDLSAPDPGEPPPGRPWLDDPGDLQEPGEARPTPGPGRPQVPPLVVPLGTPPLPAGARRARPAATTAGEPAWARHNWVATGPRNVGGRVRALVGHPTEPDTLYAGAAAGGVYRTRDRGESWQALWHEQRALAVGALGVGVAGGATVVYAATGEPESEGEIGVLGDGVHVSRDGGDTWDAAGPPSPPGTAPDLGWRFEAVAVRPDDADECWAVGAAGVFRTVDGGGTWTQHLAGRRVTDALFTTDPGALTGVLLYLVPAREDDRGEVHVVRLALPATATAAQVDAALADPGNRMVVVPRGTAVVPAGRRPSRAKLAVCANHPDTAYLRVSAADGEHHLGLFRTTQARRPLPEPAGTRWDRVRDHPSWPRLGQASYDLSLGVHPDEPGTVATGMTELHLSYDCDAAATGTPPTVPASFVRAMAWDHAQEDRGHHADHHVALFRADPDAPARGALWVANDGGVSRSLDWSPTGTQTPADKEWPGRFFDDDDPSITFTDEDAVPETAVPWRKRSAGINGTMMYSLAQHPLLPGTVALGLQDNGVWMGTGGPTWASVGGGDGGFVAFQPDDPYRLLLTSQVGVQAVAFAGLVDDVLAARRRRPVPLASRRLTEGFLPVDPPAFVADTAHHPRDPGRAYHARENRLYATAATGEAWVPLDVGDRLELLHTAATGLRASLEVRPSRAAAVLGLAPQRATAAVPRRDPVVDLDRQQRPTASVVALAAGPFALTAGDELVLVLDGTVRTVPLAVHPTVPDLARATAAQLAAYLRATQAPALDARLRFEPAPGGVELSTRATGTTATLDLGGTALAVQTTGASPVPALGVAARRYTGSAGRPAAVTLVPYRRRGSTPSPAGNRVLTVSVGGAPAVPVALDPTTCADPSSPTAGELAAALRAALPAGAVDVRPVSRRRQLRLAFLPSGAGGLVLAGTMLPRLGGAVAGAQREHLLTPQNGEAFDLRPPGAAALVLRIGDGVGTVAVRVRVPQDVPDLATVTLDELRRVVDARLAAHYGAGPRRARVDLTDTLAWRGRPVEVRSAPSDPDVLWVGSTSGAVFRSGDSGLTWQSPPPDQVDLLARRGNRVGAVAVDPARPQTVWVGLRDNGARPDAPGTLWRTQDGGTTWQRREAGLRDPAGRFLGVNALAVDPQDGGVLYAATEAGVFRTGDAGASWEPFSAGLPAGRVIDLALEPATRLLRAGVWGRGTWARSLSDSPPADVQVLVRSHALEERLRPAGRPLDALAPVPASPPLDACPDVKLVRVRPASLGPAGVDAAVDGVEFDLDVEHEPPQPGPGTVFVQVHNAGWAVPRGLRVAVLWAPALDGPPALPPALWTAWAAGPLPAGPLAGSPGLDGWQVLLDRALPDLPPEPLPDATRPRVVGTDVVWPGTLSDVRRIGLLVLVQATGDPLRSTSTDVLELVQSARQAAYRETATRAAQRTRLVVEALGEERFDLADVGPTGAAGTLSRLGVTTAAALQRVAVRGTAFDLSAPAAPARGLRVTVDERTLDVEFAPGDPLLGPTAADLRALSIAQVVDVITREVARAGLPLQVMGARWTSTPPVTTPRLRAVDRSGATAAAAAPSSAQPRRVALGLATAFAALLDATGPGVHAPYDLRPVAAGTRVLRLRVRQSAVVPLTGFAAPTAVTVDVLQARLERELRRRSLPLRARVGEIALRTRRRGSSGARAAQVVAAPSAVPAGPAREALLSAPGAGTPLLPRGASTALYLRTSDDGDVAQVDGRHRLFAVPLPAAPAALVPAQVGADVTATVPAGGSVVVEQAWDTSALAAGSAVAVLAVADAVGEAEVAVPASFADLAALDRWCARRLETGYRVFRAD